MRRCSAAFRARARRATRKRQRTGALQDAVATAVLPRWSIALTDLDEVIGQSSGSNGGVSVRPPADRAAGAWWQIEEVGESSDPRVPFVINGEQAKGYWIVQAPKQIINGHGGIFNDNAIDFIAGLYKMCRAEIRTRRPVLLTPVGGNKQVN